MLRKTLAFRANDANAPVQWTEWVALLSQNWSINYRNQTNNVYPGIFDGHKPP